MNLEDFTPFTPVSFIGQKDGAGYLATVLVKAVFRMRHGHAVEIADEQQFPTADMYPEGAEPGAASLTYASDLVPFKPLADILLAATAYRPATHPTGPFPVGMQVGSLYKQLAISGRHEFEHGLLSSTAVERDPMVAIPITYENALGGIDNPANPVGRGSKSAILPQVEYFDQRNRRSGNRPAPAGFGPIAPHWEPRKSMLGTFGKDYLTKWPGFPADFDPRFFNAAPLDQQVDGYLRGNEEIILENLHPRHSVYATKLPNLRVVCLREDESGACALIPLSLDTLWLKPDEDLLILAWRGQMHVQSPDALEIKQLGFLVEPLDSPLRDVAYYSDRLRSLVEERDRPFEPESASDELEQLGPVAAEPSTIQETGAQEDADEFHLNQVKAEVAALRARYGHPPEEQIESAPPPLSAEAQAAYDEIVSRIEKEDRQQEEEEAAKKWTRERVIAAVANRQSLDGADLSKLDLSQCDFTEGDFVGAKLDEVDFSHSTLIRVVMAGCSIESAIFDHCRLDSAILIGARCSGASLQQASLVDANLASADFSDTNLDGAKLDKVNADQAIFDEASLAGASFSNAVLTNAAFSAVKGAAANFGGAMLAGAVGTGGDFSGGSFLKADLSGVVFSACKLVGANFDGANAMNADFTDAELADSSFKNANCEGMWLSSAKADRANFQGACCTDLQLDATSARGANFSNCTITTFRGSRGADLTGANFRGAQGESPIFEDCRLDGANLTKTEIAGASFVQASVVGSDFSAATLTGARFDYANCENANFSGANLFEANFAGANLTNANISQANLFRAEFLDARITGLQFAGCNLNSTKLEQWAATRTKA